MIIMTAKVPRLKGGTPAATASVICCLALLFGLSKEPFQEAMSQSISQPSPQVTVKNEKEARSYLESLGWVLGETSLGVETLWVPQVLDESYQDYLSLQASQGFPSLENLTGQKVTQYRYTILNHPSGEAQVEVHLLSYEGEIVAGEVLSSQVGGFLHGLAMPQETGS